MKIDVSFKYLEKNNLIEAVLDKNLLKIKKRIKMFNSDTVHIAIHLEKNPNHQQYFCYSHIYLPTKVIKAETKGEDLIKSIERNFSALIKQLDKVKYKIEKHLHRPKVRLTDI